MCLRGKKILFDSLSRFPASQASWTEESECSCPEKILEFKISGRPDWSKPGITNGSIVDISDEPPNSLSSEPKILQEFAAKASSDPPNYL